MKHHGNIWKLKKNTTQCTNAGPSSDPRFPICPLSPWNCCLVLRSNFTQIRRRESRRIAEICCLKQKLTQTNHLFFRRWFTMPPKNTLNINKNQASYISQVQRLIATKKNMTCCGETVWKLPPQDNNKTPIKPTTIRYFWEVGTHPPCFLAAKNATPRNSRVDVWHQSRWCDLESFEESRGKSPWGWTTYQWLFLVPLKGGRWHTIPQLAVYTTYIPLILYIAFWGVICYLLPFRGTRNSHWYVYLPSLKLTVRTWKGGWKMNVLLGIAYFQGRWMLVSGRVQYLHEWVVCYGISVGQYTSPYPHHLVIILIYR